KKVKLLEAREGAAAERSGDDAPIKGRSLDEGEAAAERASNDKEEMETILTSMDATTVLVNRAAAVPTGSGSIPTAGPPAAEVPLAVMWFPLRVQFLPLIDAQVARELEEQLEREDQRRSEQISRDAEIKRIHDEEELQIMIDGLDSNNETIAKYLQELEGERLQGYDFEEVEAKFNSVWKQMEDFIPIGSKEEAERIKSKESPNEVPEEKVKEMIQLVPIKEVYVEALQVKHPIID
nr:hypothetical protein [Tanacetum cinerariifolium]